MKTKLLSLLLALVLVVSALSAISASADGNYISVYSGKRDTKFWTKLMNSGATEATIKTADQLMAFATMTHSIDFEGWTIKLGADMVINTGDASTWGTTAPDYQWKCSTGWSTRFAGDFDGQGHVISGLYSKYNQECGLFGTITGGNTIQNVSIINSYFEYETDDSSTACLMGGIVGYIDGNNNTGKYDGLTTTIQNVYVNATLYTACDVPASNNSIGVGGIVGIVGNTSEQYLDMKNVVFEGNLTSSYRNVGGLVGRVNFYSTGEVTLNGCSVNANIKSTATQEPTVGGLIGTSNANIDIANCIVQGTIEVANKSMTSGLIGLENAAALRTVSASKVLLAITPIPTGDDNVIIRTQLMNYYVNSGKSLILDLDNIKYDSGLYEYPAEMKQIDKTAETAATGDDFKATGVATADLLGQPVFTGWTAVPNDYPIPAGINVPNIVLATYQNAVDGTPADVGSEEPAGEGDPYADEDEDWTIKKPDPKKEDTSTTTDTTDTTTTETPAKKKGGCGSTVGVAGLSVLALVAVAAVVPFKKKETR